MNTVTESSAAEAESLQARVADSLQRARALLAEDKLEEAAGGLETTLAAARENPYKVEFRTHIELALTLAEIYLEAEALEKARAVLNERAEFAEKIFQIMQATGTNDQKREAAGGRIQIRDRARQVALLGTEAPEISVRDWLVGEPATLSRRRLGNGAHAGALRRDGHAHALPD
jgi:DNA-dependent RNA polymerase auxiliary subunit epsilon